MKIAKTGCVIMLLFTGSLFNMSCQRKDKQNQTAVHIPPYENTDHTTSNQQDKETGKFKDEWNKKIDKLNEKINKAEKELKNTPAAHKEQIEIRISNLKDKKNVLQRRINDAGNKSKQDWDSFKQKTDQQYDSLSDQLDKIIKREK